MIFHSLTPELICQTLSDQGFMPAAGGQCKLAAPVKVELNKGNTPVKLTYHYSSKPTPSGSCVATQTTQAVKWGSTDITQFHLAVTLSNASSGKQMALDGQLNASSSFNQKAWGSFNITNNTISANKDTFTGSVWQPSFTLDGYLNGKSQEISSLIINGAQCKLQTTNI